MKRDRKVRARGVDGKKTEKRRGEDGERSERCGEREN